jgi:hypothetical protein
MLYYGGSTFGYNGVPTYADRSGAPSTLDPNVEVLVYYTDFYGYNAINIPAAWRYGRNIVLTSVHPEADNCTTAQDSDCPPAGSLSTADILRNRAWLCEYINQAARTAYAIPPVPVAPSFNTSAPHDHSGDGVSTRNGYPLKDCYASASSPQRLLFCDDFDGRAGSVPPGLAVQFQRNQSNYNLVHPWNTSFIQAWGGQQYAAPYAGDGYAVNVPQASTRDSATILTRPFPLSLTGSGSGSGTRTGGWACGKLNISYAYTGRTAAAGALTVSYAYSTGSGEGGWDDSDAVWSTLQTHSMQAQQEAPGEGGSSLTSWTSYSALVATPADTDGGAALLGRVKFDCNAGSDAEYFCAIDSVTVTCAW